MDTKSPSESIRIGPGVPLWKHTWSRLSPQLLLGCVVAFPAFRARKARQTVRTVVATKLSRKCHALQPMQTKPASSPLERMLHVAAIARTRSNFPVDARELPTKSRVFPRTSQRRYPLKADRSPHDYVQSILLRYRDGGLLAVPMFPTKTNQGQNAILFRHVGVPKTQNPRQHLDSGC